MKKIFIGTILSLYTTLLGAQPVVPTWTIGQVQDKERNTVGYIYHTYAIGTRYSPIKQKNTTGLRIVCSVKGSHDPIIGIFWDGAKEASSTDVQVKIRVDGKDLEQNYTWMQDGKLIYRSINESPELLKALKTNKRIYFDLTDAESNRRATMFNLTTFDSFLDDFNTVCRLRL